MPQTLPLHSNNINHIINIKRERKENHQTWSLTVLINLIIINHKSKKHNYIWKSNKVAFLLLVNSFHVVRKLSITNNNFWMRCKLCRLPLRRSFQWNNILEPQMFLKSVPKPINISLQLMQVMYGNGQQQLKMPKRTQIKLWIIF